MPLEIPLLRQIQRVFLHYIATVHPRLWPLKSWKLLYSEWVIIETFELSEAGGGVDAAGIASAALHSAWRGGARQQHWHSALMENWVKWPFAFFQHSCSWTRRLQIFRDNFNFYSFLTLLPNAALWRSKAKFWGLSQLCFKPEFQLEFWNSYRITIRFVLDF